MTANLGSQVKTAYVLNFIKFTEWPAEVEAADSLTLCVAGNNALDGALATLEGRMAGRHKLHVVQYTTENILDINTSGSGGLSVCNAIFIGESEKQRYIQIIKSFAGSAVLTISDIDNFAEKGGGIGLHYREGKIIFEINMASVQRAKLHLPAQFLNLASYIFTR